MTKYLHTMIRVSALEDTIAFFEVLGLREIRRRPDEKGRYTNVFLAAPGDEAAAVELTYNLGSRDLHRRPQFRSCCLCRGQHLRHLQSLYRSRCDDQPPAA
jgi:catechol 2,3-dioxygenase-like lactoylglutathione lyase family enzyme